MSDFLCLNEADPIDFPCAKQCAECMAIEEREKNGKPPADPGEGCEQGEEPRG